MQFDIHVLNDSAVIGTYAYWIIVDALAWLGNGRLLPRTGGKVVCLVTTRSRHSGNL